MGGLDPGGRGGGVSSLHFFVLMHVLVGGDDIDDLINF